MYDRDANLLTVTKLALFAGDSDLPTISDPMVVPLTLW